jgi:hypothetical protein
VDHATATDLVGRIVEKLGEERAAFLVRHTVRGPRCTLHDLWMVNPEILTLQADDAANHWLCPKCLPGYAFPPQATVLSFDDREDELARDPAIALTEYAPGNFVYYRGQRYEVTHARPRTRQMQPDVEPVEVCPACERAYLGPQETRRAACLCAQDLSGVHPRQALPLSDMYARRRARITADEEERLRIGYEVTKHYMAGGQRSIYQVSAEGHSAFQLTLEHDGRVLLLTGGRASERPSPEASPYAASATVG